MIEIAKRLGGMTHIVTSNLFEDKKMLQLTFYEIRKLKEGKSEAAFRTFLSDSDYITQDLKVSKVKWLTAAFDGMWNFSLLDYAWDSKKEERFWKENAFIRSEEEKKIIEDFFRQYGKPEDQHKPWDAIRRFQDKVKETRLLAKHKRETDRIDAAMNPIQDAPGEFFDWIWESGMSFSRYLIYKGEGKGKAVCECTHCKKIGAADRKKLRLRNNEKGVCPFCGSPVTIKAKGRMPAQTFDERWFLYVNPMQDGFALRYFKAVRRIKSDAYIDADLNKDRVEQYAHERRRVVCAFPGGKLKSAAYEWGAYKQRGNPRWRPDSGKMDCMHCVLYPGNLPQAWAHTPMKYSALEVLARSLPTEPLCYERAMGKHLEFPKLEWLCKMGLHSLAKDIINDRGYFDDMVGKVNYEGKTIYEILGLTKVNVRTLQAVDGNRYMLRLLQAAQEAGIQFKPEGLQEYYDAFQCNTELLKPESRKASLHKLVKYIQKESERYPLEEKGGCWQYSDMGNAGCADSRIERMRDTAKDWLEYLGWCEKLKYDLDSMFVYMPTNFKKVHDRTYKEYQEQRDRIAAEEKKRREREAAKRMARARRDMEGVFKKRAGAGAFEVSGKRLALLVPRSASEIKAEGEALHHCVGGYVDRVAKGETMVLFVRKSDALQEPYYTMEWNGSRVVQCRGFENRAMTPDVKAFAEAFEKKLLDAMKKGEKEC